MQAYPYDAVTPRLVAAPPPPPPPAPGQGMVPIAPQMQLLQQPLMLPTAPTMYSQPQAYGQVFAQPVQYHQNAASLQHQNVASLQHQNVASLQHQQHQQHQSAAGLQHQQHPSAAGLQHQQHQSAAGLQHQQHQSAAGLQHQQHQSAASLQHQQHQSAAALQHQQHQNAAGLQHQNVAGNGGHRQMSANHDRAQNTTRIKDYTQKNQSSDMSDKNRMNQSSGSGNSNVSDDQNRPRAMQQNRPSRFTDGPVPKANTSILQASQLSLPPPPPPPPQNSNNRTDGPMQTPGPENSGNTGYPNQMQSQGHENSRYSNQMQSQGPENSRYPNQMQSQGPENSRYPNQQRNYGGNSGSWMQQRPKQTPSGLQGPWKSQQDTANQGEGAKTSPLKRPLDETPEKAAPDTSPNSKTATKPGFTAAPCVYRDMAVDPKEAALPKELTSQFEALVCKLCSATLSSTVQAKLHYTGKPHEKKVRAYLVTWSQKTGQPLPKRQKIESSKEAVAPEDLYCSICDVSFSSLKHGEQHKMGKAHQKALKRGYSAKKPKKPEVPEDPTGRFNIGTSFLPPSETDVKSTAESPVSAAPASSAAPPKFFCDLCQVSTTSQEHLVTHMGGAKHKKALAKLAKAGGNVNVPQSHIPPPSVSEDCDANQYKPRRKRQKRPSKIEASVETAT